MNEASNVRKFEKTAVDLVHTHTYVFNDKSSP